MTKMLLLVALGTVGLAGCATPPKVALTKTIEANGEQLLLGGSYVIADREVTLTINGDPVMRGKFPPFTPSLNLKGTYKNFSVTAACRFGSVLSSHKSLLGTISGAVQAGIGKGNDICDISIPGRPAETLYF